MSPRRRWGRPVPPDEPPPDDIPPPREGDVPPALPGDEETTRVIRPRRTSGEVRDVRDVRETEVRTARRPVPPPERNPWPWLLALLLLVLGGLAAAYFLTRDNNDKKDKKNTPVAVPSVVGSTAPAAAGTLRRAGFKPRVRRIFSTKPKGLVARQDPAAGTRLLRGSPVALLVSKGPSFVAVPNLRGLTEAQAASKLTALGLRASVFRVPSTEAEGKVIAQKPLPDERVQKGERVRINVSRGVTQTSTTVVTPTTATTTTPTTTTPTTTPTTTTPGTGSTAGGGGTTTTPAKNVTVPDLGGVSEKDAATQLQAVGLLADSYPVASSETGGTVVAQKPTAGQTLTAGAVVRLNVALGTGARAQRAIPDVTGISERAARTRLFGVGFTVRAIYRQVSAQDQNGKVILQRPDAGASARAWFQITIYVGRLGATPTPTSTGATTTAATTTTATTATTP